MNLVAPNVTFVAPNVVTPSHDLNDTHKCPQGHPHVTLVAPKHDLGGTQHGGTQMSAMTPSCDPSVTYM